MGAYKLIWSSAYHLDHESDLHSNEHLLINGKNRVFSLLAQLVEHYTYIAEVMGSNLVWAWSFFSGLIFTTAWVVLTTAKIDFIFTSLSAVQMIFAYSQSEKETAWNYWMYENF